MEPCYLMGLDIGGRSGRCIMVRLPGGQVSAASRGWELRPVPGSGGFGFELDPARIKDHLAGAVRETLEKAGAKPSQVGTPPLPARNDVPASASKAGASAPLVHPGELDPRAELVAMVHEQYATGRITATGGNISIRVPDQAHQVYISPSHLFKGDLRPEMMVRIDMEGNSLDPEALSPSSERGVHCAIYKIRPDIAAVIHAHAPWSTILMLSDLPFLPISTEAAFFKDLPVVPFIMPGSQELAEAVGKAIGKGVVVLMQNHGVVVGGSSLRQAANHLEVLERTAQTLLWCQAVGRKPKILPKDVVKMLGEMGDMIA